MFSFILPAFNAENTIEKTISSILNNQTSQSIEIIIINDGSTDSTFKILEQYSDDPRIKIINQKNKGVSSARNAGLNALDKASIYTAFIDDSDTISENYIDTHTKMFEAHPELGLSIAPIILMKNEKKVPQSLNDRFNYQKDVINIEKYPKAVQYHVGGTVFKSDLFTKQGYRFNEKITFWEDAYLINSILIKLKRYGLAKGTYYFYDRNNAGSLSQTAWSKQSRYTSHIKDNYMPLIQLSKQKYGAVIPYIQFLIVRHYIQYLVEYNQPSINKYKQYIDQTFYDVSVELFRNIDQITIDNLDCPLYIKKYLYHLKHAKLDVSDIRKHIKILIQGYDYKKGSLYFTFSNEATGIPGKSKVASRNSIAEIVSVKHKYLLGEKIEPDVTANKYKIKMNILRVLFGFKLSIYHDNQVNVAKRSSVFRNVYIKIKRKISK